MSKQVTWREYDHHCEDEHGNKYIVNQVTRNTHAAAMRAMKGEVAGKGHRWVRSVKLREFKA